ncbi:MAG: relaxase, partial [Algicola sp.]|nr:relaxase [Algicola sp.]
MILEGNERGGAKNLALHLLKDENDHVTIHELRGFMADSLLPALNEIYAVSRGTKSQKFMFSLSLNPPKTENVSTADFEDAIERVERKLGLDNQPRAVVFHEKKGRRHCHVAWSKIDSINMKAIP